MLLNQMNHKKYLLLLLIFTCIKVNAQKTPSLIIDSTEIQFSDVSLPFWLKAGQSVGLGVNAKIISVLEFSVNGTALDFSRVLTLTSKQTVPSNKAWKIEGIGLNKGDTLAIFGSSQMGSSSTTSSMPFLLQSPMKFENPGTYSWKVPPGVTSIWIEVWGAGGRGGTTGSTTASFSSGGGGGSYGYARFTVVPGTLYTVSVGAGGSNSNTGNGETSSVGNLISAAGGTRGGFVIGTGCASLAGGAGGTSSASFNLSGEAGASTLPCNGPITGRGGNAAYGGLGGSGAVPSNVVGGSGTIPGGGGGGAWANSGSVSGGPGARGQVYIYF
jgi:hypothetical protein